MTTTTRKKQTLRNNEYYDMQSIFDELYSLSSKGSKFTKLLEIINSERNIRLAYRNIKNNKGSMTYGVDKKNILDIASKDMNYFISKVQNKLNNYKPKPIKRVYIPKKNGKLRPLGIPCMEDRIIQQCIKQVLEPICEAKFYKHSYGFRPNRGCKYAIARCNHLINKGQYYYVIDFDIKGFFDNVNHGKLLKQIWSLGIQDKRVISIISKMLKSEVDGVEIMDKGTPQGGVLSPLLANIVLNELDWWISSQWGTFKTNRKEYAPQNLCRALKNTKLKEIRIVRYADDFKIFCKSYNVAKRTKYALTNWLEERLNLECSEEKTKITNLRKNYSEFLGIEFKAIKKANKYVSRSKMTKSSKNKCFDKIKENIKIIYKNRNRQSMMNYNSTVIGMHNYYNMATLVSIDMNRIDFNLRRTLYNKLNRIAKKVPINKSCKFYQEYRGLTYSLNNVALFPVYACKNKPTMCMTQKISDYTVEGRKLIHQKLEQINMNTLQYICKNPLLKESVELNDNRLSLYTAQRGRCIISKEILKPHDLEVHHKVPRHVGGTDEYSNLVLVNANMHKLIHCTSEVNIKKYYKTTSWDNNKKKMLNKLRKLVGNSEI